MLNGGPNNIPPVTAAICATMTILYLLTHLSPSVPRSLSLTAGTVLSSFEPWTLVTWCLVHSSLPSALASIGFAVISLPRIEAIIGKKTVAGLMCATAGLAGFASVFVMFGRYVVDFRPRFLFAELHGFEPVASMIAVAWRAYLPDEPVVPGFDGIRGGSLVAVVIAGNFVISLLAPERLVFDVFNAPLGFLFGWYVIRFWAKPEDPSGILSLSSVDGISAGMRGTAAENMSFASFFPDPIRAPVAKISALIWPVGRLIVPASSAVFSPSTLPTANDNASSNTSNISGINNPNRSNNHSISISNSNVAANINTSSLGNDVTGGTAKKEVKPLPGNDIADAERRRQKAMEALNKRLASMAKVPQIPLDEDDKASEEK